MRRHEIVHGAKWHNGHTNDFFIPVLGLFPATEVNTLGTIRDEFHAWSLYICACYAEEKKDQEN
jgi:hypothetical protein